MPGRAAADRARSVLFYTDSRELGGAEHALLTLIETLDRDAWRPTLMIDNVGEAEGLASAAWAREIPVRTIAPTPLGLTGARRVPRLTGRLATSRLDVFHAVLSWPLAAKYPLAAAIAARVPAVVATVQLIPPGPISRASLLQLRALSRGVGRYIAVSRDIADELRDRFRWSPRKIEVIHNVVSTTRFGAAAPAELREQLTDRRPWPVVLTCARLHPQKGHAQLLEAAARLPETVFVLAGDGALRPALEAKAKELQIGDRVRFLGYRTDIPELLATCDLFVLPSLYEGTSLAVLEAMAAARPVVASAVGGTPELITDSETGVLVPPGDVDALTAAIRRLLADDRLRATLGAAARQRAACEFTPEAMAARTTRIYDELLGVRKPR